ncbi:hypothetical protein HHL11_10590 [Ramlibacter sp. G-1-2-2]|uniref:Uncharacterized protein n=1 Tax=Ramlibacter agri TaxID=2728837 RepID=A0A848H970_9BURK|nr:hypothetical protein [Ramlibacter agri]NML44198.1 hypothetical protein [Ramlibacter agri]
MRANPFEEHFAAVAAERAAWDAARNRMPGMPEFDHETWEAWCTAVRRSDEARRAMMQAVAGRPFSI